MQCETRTIQDKTEELTLFNTAQRAPSAYNTQPWHLCPQADDSYLLEYTYADRLQSDKDDRNAFLSIGAYYETLSMAASLRGKQVSFDPQLVQRNDGMELGKIHIQSLSRHKDEILDPLAPFLTLRQTNRNPYEHLPLSPKLRKALLNSGCVLLEPQAVAPVVGKASMLAWQDARCIADLKKWTRFSNDGNASDGVTGECLCLSWAQRRAWNLAAAGDRLAAPLARVYAQHEVRLIQHSAAIAVLSVESLEPLALFECGRRFLRAWVTINAAAFSCHPMFAVVNQPTVTELAQIAGVAHPVAILRVGYTFKSAAWSQRRGVESFHTTQSPDQ